MAYYLTISRPPHQDDQFTKRVANQSHLKRILQTLHQIGFTLLEDPSKAARLIDDLAGYKGYQDNEMTLYFRGFSTEFVLTIEGSPPTP